METKNERKLVTIMFTDIVGYSRIMQDDEQKGIQIRKRHRKVFREMTRKFDGELLQYFGDGTLSIFQKSSDAVECAVHMQRQFQMDPKVPLRIGIHEGDIIFTEDDAYGHGMNIAARIEPICIPGGIYISSDVNNSIANHQWLTSKSLGFFELKNINDAMEVFAVTNDGINTPEHEVIPAHFKASAPDNVAVKVAAPDHGYKLKKRAAFIALFFGILGAHRFYLGQRGLGIAYFASFIMGIIGAVWFLIAIPAMIGVVDAITFFGMTNKEFDFKFNTAATPKPKKRRKETVKQPIVESTPQGAVNLGSELTLSEKAYKAIKFGDFELAIECFKELLKLDPDDEEFHFSLAVSYSMLQDAKNGFYHLSKAVEYGYENFQKINNHFTLAYLRSRKEYPSFQENGYRLIKMLPSPQEDLLDSERPLLLEKLEKLEELGELLYRGEITEEEFSNFKKDLLG